MYSGECTHMYIVTVQIYSCARDLIRLLLETLISGFIFYEQSGHKFGGTGQISNLGAHFFPKKGGGMHPTLLLYSVYLQTILLVKGRVLVALIGLLVPTQLEILLLGNRLGGGSRSPPTLKKK